MRLNRRGSSVVPAPACRQAGAGRQGAQPYKMHYIYIIRSDKDGGYYTGLTSDLDRRVREHNKSDTKSTRSRKPWRIVYSEAYATLKEARAREKYLKSGVGRELRKKLLPR